MSDLLLLKNREVCPACRRRTWPVHFSGCAACGTLLFLRPINFDQFVDDGGTREYYLFTSFNGWMHSTQLKDPQALSRDYKPPKLPENYGKHTTPEAITNRGRK